MDYELSVNEHAVVSRFFSASVIKELAQQGSSSMLGRLILSSPFAENLDSNWTVAKAYQNAFEYLRRESNRNEYVYKTALTQRLALGVHSLRSASVLSEFRVGNCKADYAILNGTSTVYEIKSERDTLCRLDEQLKEYRKFFARVNVVTGENHVDSVLSQSPEDVGILVLNSKFRLTTIREATNNPARTCPITIFESIRISEAEMLLTLIGEDIPQVPNALKYISLKEIFSRLPSEMVHSAMVRVLKESRSLKGLSEFFNMLPSSLHAAAMTISLRRQDYPRFIDAINTPINQAVKWN